MSALAAEEEAMDDYQRHASVEKDCAVITRMLRGRAAEALLEDPDAIPDRAGIVLLPVWAWRVPLLDVGRKGKAYHTGDPMLMCVRATWDIPIVAIVDPDTPTEARWRIKGMGHIDAGQVRLVRRPALDEVVAVDAVDDLTEPVLVGAAPKARVIAELRRIAKDGRDSFWDKASTIQRDMRRILEIAHVAVSHEIAGSESSYMRVLDETALDDIETELLYGTDGREGSLARGLELCLKPNKFEKVDPAKFLSTHYRRDAEMAIRRRIGDPHIGPKIREVRRQNPHADVDTLIGIYREAYPADRLGEDRVEAALSAGADIHARTTALNPETAYPAAVRWEAA